MLEEIDRPEEAIEIPYRPRPHFLALHASPKRWIFACSHRRAGKTVALANHLIRAAGMNPRQWPPPKYGYVGPSFEQAKDLVWGYLRQYTGTIPGMKYHEADLETIFPSGASIKLYGGDAAYQRMRGMYFDGIVLDEYPLLNAQVFSTVVRPCLADYRGFAVVSGTSNGDDHFNALRLKAEVDPRWDVFIIPISDTGISALSKEEQEELTLDMSPEEYAREMQCFVKGTLVATSRGHVPIEDIRPGDSVLTHRGRWRPVMKTMKRDYAGEGVVLTAYGSSAPLVSTAEHPYRVYAKESHSYSWRAAKEVGIGECLFLPTPRSQPKSVITAEMAALIAWYVAEGSVFANNLVFSLNPKKPDEIEHVLALINGCGAEAKDRKPGSLVVANVALADRMTAWCGSLARNKRIPFDVIGGWEHVVFKELMLGDGCLSQPVQGGHCWLYTTISRPLAFDVQLLAGMLGKRAGIYAHPSGRMISPNNGKEYQASPSYQVRIPYGTKVNHSRTREAFPTANGVAYRVKSVTDVPLTAPVFNLSVKEDESYVVEGRAVHNCSFDAPVEGAYYGDSLNKLQDMGRIAAVPPDLAVPAISAWDLGISDDMCVWVYQVVGREVHWIDYFDGTGRGLEHYTKELQRRAKAGGYMFKCHCLPHDVEARELATGQSRRAVLETLLDEPIIVAPLSSPEDGIAAARGILGISWFDKQACKRGLSMLRGYRRNKAGRPVHDANSHCADSFRTAASSFHLVAGYSRSGGLRKLRRRIRGLM